ncbi:CotH kinase family protein [Flavobacteriales bacterium]|nr:CotH kinase family protein [Flavobacteriales bacterium]
MFTLQSKAYYSFFLCLVTFSLSFNLHSQTLFNYSPQGLYDGPGGMYEKDSLRTLYVNFHDPNYHSILQNSFFTNPSYRIPASITLGDITLDSIGVRYKGNSTFCIPNDNGVPKVPYNLDMNYWISGQKLLGYKKLKLANAWMDATFQKEYIASKIYQKYLPSPEVNLMKLNVQGNYLGLYVNTESINKQFAKKHFDYDDGALFKCDASGMFCDTTGTPPGGYPGLNWNGSSDSTLYYSSYDIKSNHGWKEFIDMIYALNFTPNNLDSFLNIDRALWAFAVNTVIGNFDSYNGYYVHNYYMYQNEDNLFQMIPWDLSQSFINALLGWDIFTPLGPTHPTQYDPYYGSDPSLFRPLTEFLFNNAEYRRLYTAHLRTVINEIDTNQIRSEVQTMQAMAYTAMDNDIHKLFSSADYFNNVEQDISNLAWGGYGFGGIMSCLRHRIPFLLAHSEISATPPNIFNVQVDNGIITANVNNESYVELMATVSEYNSKFTSFNMYDDGTNGDDQTNDGIYSCYVPFATSPLVKFYVKARNSQAMMLSPERAEYEFYEYYSISHVLDKPQSINKEIVFITDMLGKKSKFKYNTPLIFIYNDGSAEKKFFVK